MEGPRMVIRRVLQHAAPPPHSSQRSALVSAIVTEFELVRFPCAAMPEPPPPLTGRMVQTTGQGLGIFWRPYECPTGLRREGRNKNAARRYKKRRYHDGRLGMQRPARNVSGLSFARPSIELHLW